MLAFRRFTKVTTLESVPATQANRPAVVDASSTPCNPRLAGTLGILAVTIREPRSRIAKLLSPALDTTACNNPLSMKQEAECGCGPTGIRATSVADCAFTRKTALSEGA